ncbi:MAG TPA: hypothetical protein VNV65_08980 [Candidatus Solibacter sp.]|nr:hypothetical protein [Candidatus Solibacter sp.]
MVWILAFAIFLVGDFALASLVGLLLRRRPQARAWRSEREMVPV